MIKKKKTKYVKAASVNQIAPVPTPLPQHPEIMTQTITYNQILENLKNEEENFGDSKSKAC